MTRILLAVPLAVVLAGTGAAPALAAVQYSPPTSDQLLSLRQCESSNHYDIDTGNGYYGAYQFDDETWAGYEDPRTYPHASDAPAGVQDDAASRLWQDRGTTPWASCAKSRNLSASPVEPVTTTVPPGDSSSAQPVTRLARVVGRPAGIVARPAGARPTPAQPVSSAPVVLPPAATPAPRRTVAAAAPGAARRVAQPGIVQPAVTPATHPRFDGHVITVSDVNARRDDVQVWQQRMKDRGWTIDADGFYGEKSRGVAAAFSRQKGVVDTVAGEVGKSVWDAAWEYPVS